MIYIIAIIFVIIMFWIGVGKGKKEAEVDKLQTLGVGKDFEDFATEASTLLVWVVGYCKRKKVNAPQQLVSPLLTPTTERAFDHIQFVGTNLKRMDKSADMRVLYGESERMIRFSSVATQEVLVLNSQLLFIWYFNVADNQGKFTFVGPYDGSNRIDILESLENSENHHVEVVGENGYLNLMRDEFLQQKLIPAMESFIGYDFYMSNERDAARPDMEELRLFCERANAIGLTATGPSVVFEDGNLPGLPQNDLERLYARAYRLAKGIDSPIAS